MPGAPEIIAILVVVRLRPRQQPDPEVGSFARSRQREFKKGLAEGASEDAETSAASK